MSLPLIGITTNRRDSDSGNAAAFGLAEVYVRAVERAGGLPVMLPLGLADEAVQALYDRLDGLLFSGGGDVQPEIFGAGTHETLSGIDPDRDRLEIAMIRRAASEGKPFLGICRGIQVINVALGGDLFLDTSRIPGAAKHAYFPGYPRDHMAHPVAVEEESRLAQAVGVPLFEVNSMHHQAVKQPAPGLRVVARAPDGVIEGVELPEHRFGLAVQWHPECIPAAPSTGRLFRAFVQAARRS